MARYTDNPLELETQTTVVTPAALLPLLQPLWPELTPLGARALVAHCMLETTGGTHCFNWNLGNVKASIEQGHCYLHGVWECLLPEAAAREIASGGRHPSIEEYHNRPWWKCDSGKVLVVFDPPHYQTRFAAFASLADGAAFWVAKHRRIAGQLAEYLGQLNAGDTTGATHSLRLAHYYTGSEAGYAQGMAAALAKLPPWSIQDKMATLTDGGKISLDLKFDAGNPRS